MIMMGLCHMFLLEPLTSTYHHLLPPKNGSSTVILHDTSSIQVSSGDFRLIHTPFLIFLQVAYSIFGTSTVFST